MGSKKILIGLLSAIGAVLVIVVTFVSLAISGTIPVLKNKIEIQSMTYSKVYDGKPVDSDSYEISSGSLYAGDTLEVTFITTATDVGSYTNDFSVKIKNKSGHDVTANYDIKTNFGKLTITARPLTLKVKDASEPYDGKKLTASEYEFVDKNLVDGEYLEVYYEGEITDVGEVKSSVIPHIYTADHRDVTSNYKITALDGTLVKTAISLTLTSKTDGKTYDGTEFKDESKEPFLMEGSLIEGDVLSYVSTATITNSGEVENVFNATISNDGKDVTYRYTIHKNYGKLTVDPLAVFFKSKDYSDEIFYTGTVFDLTNDELDEADAIAATDELNFTFTAKPVNAGVYSNKFYVKITDKESGTDTSSNYKITLSYGTLEILPRPITLKTVSATKTYDGYVSGGWDTTNGLSQNYSIVGSFAEGESGTPSFQKISANVGTYRNLASLRILDSTGQNVTSNYDISYDIGDLTILQRAITIQTSSASKEYDGKALTSPDWYLMSGTLAENEYLAADTTGSQTKVGTSSNGITWRITNSEGIELTNATSNYKVTLVQGILSVYNAEKKNAYIVPKDRIISKTEFDALGTGSMTAETVLGFEDYAIDGYELSCEFDASLDGPGSTIVGIKENTVKVTKISNGEDVTDQFVFTYGKGHLRVYREKFEIVTATPLYDTTDPSNPVKSPQKNANTSVYQYDGTALSDDRISLGGQDFTSGTASITLNGSVYQISYTNTSSQTVVGQSLNKINITSLSKDGVAIASDIMSSEYYFAITYGTLEIGRRQLSVTTASKDVISSSTIKSVSASDIADQIIGELALGDVAYVKNSYTLDHIGTAENKLEIGIKNAAGVDVTDYYIISYTYGTLRLK